MKIRIFALAKELGIDSKELIEFASQAGVQVKNSALASISPEERDVVVQFIEARSKSDSPARAEQTPPRPTAVVDPSAKVRQLPPVRPRSTPPRPAAKPAPAPESPAAPEAPPTVSAQVNEPEREAGGELERETREAAATATMEPEADVEVETDEAAVDEVDDVEPTETEAETESPADEETDEKSDKKIVPISRDDYVPSPGSHGSSIREMRPRGTIPESETPRAAQQKSKSRQAAPRVAAAPTYKPPKVKTPKREEGPAQKPDMKLTPEILSQQQSPLADHLRKHHEEKRRRTGDAEEQPRRGRRSSSLLEERRQQRIRLKQLEEEEQKARGKTAARRPRRQRSSAPAQLKSTAEITLPITLRGLSEAMGRPLNLLQKTLFQQGKMVTINDIIDEDVALELGLELGVDLRIKREFTVEDELQEWMETPESDELLETRPPVITILGHVDHGKTTLVDTLRSANVAGGEAGGITQHIAAYQIDHNGQKLTFVDTPGHAAFGEMRARGANVTDIVVLVVAADDGVMPQTVECISHAKAAGVPIVVAMNKIDLPDVNEPKVLQELASHDVLPSEWGGDVEVVRISALKGTGIDDLLENLLLTAELHEFKSNPQRPAMGVCLEAFRHEGRGALAWLIVQRGTLRVGDVVLCGKTYGRIRAMYNDRDEEIQEAPPSTPVRVAGLDEVPAAGDHFFVLSDIDTARETAEARSAAGRSQLLAGRSRPRTLEDILEAARGGAVQDLPLIVKADTPGSLEALRSEIEKFEHPEVRVQIVHEGVGGVNESDVSLASASGAIVVAFHVIAEDRAQSLADREGVDIRRYTIIYEVTQDIKRSLEGLLRPERVEVATGRAIVLQTFQISRIGTIAGCRVLNGTIDRSNRVHVIRDQTVLNDYNIASLRREKDDVKEVRDGMECGIRLEGFNDVKQGDLLEAYRIDEIKRTLD